VAGNHANVYAIGAPDSPLSIIERSRRISGWNRDWKPTCTGIPASRTSRTMSSTTSNVGASGFSAKHGFPASAIAAM
jgi:hypothetical protein